MSVTTIEVDRRQISRSRVHSESEVVLQDGEVRLRVEAFALTSNNITYGVFGDAMGYWNFFPGAPDAETPWGRIPVWGFAEVVETRVSDLPVGRRIYGFLPMSNQFIVKAGRLDERSFVDMSEHRAPMAAAYNRYVFTDQDPIYHPDREAQHMVLWPLFMTSFMVDDVLGQNVLESDPNSVASVVISSASSKTAIGSAHLLARRPGVSVVGLTSSKNADFVRSLDCYHRVVTYDMMSDLPSGTAADICAYVDVAGDSAVTWGVHEHYGDDLAYSLAVGGTHWDARARVPGRSLAGPKPQPFFAPTQIALRNKEWGRAGLDQRVSEAWNRFSEGTGPWLQVAPTSGPSGVEALFQELLAGRVDPSVGHICSMH